MIEIKICGITNEKEITFLNILKPEYIGFVFTKSKRQVTGKKAKELANNLSKEIKIVGVFKDNSIDDILNVISEIDLDIIQLHGKEDVEFINLLKEKIIKPINIWKAFSVNDIESIKKYTSIVDSILVDGDNPGSGETFALENISSYFREEYKLREANNANNFILAGGITPENVIGRLSKANPIGVDVSSGVEIIDDTGNRIKSYEKMKELIEKVRTRES